MDKIEFVDILIVGDDIKKQVYDWRMQDDVRLLMLNQEKFSIEQHYRWLEGLKNKREQKVWVVVYGQPVGLVQLTNMDYLNLTSEWGFYIGQLEYRDKGLGKRILLKLLTIFFADMNFERLITKVLSGNLAALKIYQRFGFKEIDRVGFDDHKQDVVIFTFNRNEWLKCKDDLERLCLQ